MLKKTVTAVLCLCMMILPAACAQTDMYTINVGKGDAILIMADGYNCLIDTGKEDAEAAVKAALERFGIDVPDAVFITHTDNDHTGGLKWLKKLPLKTLYAPGYYTGVSEKKHPAVKAAKKLDIDVTWLTAGMEIPLGDSGAVFRVLAPSGLSEDKDDNNSLVMMLDSPDGRILLTGDMEFNEEDILLAGGADLSCDVLKVPNHGDSDACSDELIAACGAKISVISTSGEDKPGTPDEFLVQALEDAGSEVYVTENNGEGILVTLDDGSVSAQYVY